MNVFVTFPRILYVGILRCIISFHLDMCRHADIIPVLAAIVCFFKSRDCTSVVAGIVEFPDSIEIVTERHCFFLRFLSISIICMVRMRIHSSISEILWIFYQRIIKSFHSYPPALLFLSKKGCRIICLGHITQYTHRPKQHPFIKFIVYLTAPVIPSANCFCSTKKTIMVGMEQNNTPHISIP